MKAKSAIIVLNWNSADDTIRCLSSLLNQTENPFIIVVDNASTDNSVDRLHAFTKQDRARFHVITNGINSGFSGGVNDGIRYAIKSGYELVGSLNPDAVADPNWLNNLQQALEKDKTAGMAVGILARSDHQTIDSTGDFYTTWGMSRPRDRNRDLSAAPKKSEYVFGASGGAFLAKSSLFKDVGLFDEKFFMYFEDADLSFRSQLLGYKVVFSPSAIAYHKVGASSDKVSGLSVKQTFQNLPLLLLKNLPVSLCISIAPRFTLLYFLLIVNAIRKGRGVYAIKGWLASVRLLPHAMRCRRNIQMRRRVSIKYIRSIIKLDRELFQG